MSSRLVLSSQAQNAWKRYAPPTHILDEHRVEASIRITSVNAGIKEDAVVLLKRIVKVVRDVEAAVATSAVVFNGLMLEVGVPIEGLPELEVVDGEVAPGAYLYPIGTGDTALFVYIANVLGYCTILFRQWRSFDAASSHAADRHVVAAMFPVISVSRMLISRA